MSIYLRKSIKVGPLRFNLSGSGIGVSGGVGAFRVGTGPRGNYVHLGKHGVYYRASLAKHERARSSLPPQAVPTPLPSSTLIDGLASIDSGDAEEMTHSSSAALLEEIRGKARLKHHWPIALVVGGIAWLIATMTVPWWASFALLGVVAAFIYQLKRRDELRKTVILMYNLDQGAEVAWQGLQNGFDWLANSQRVWHLEASGGSGDWKRNAGASHLVRRAIIQPLKADPPYIRTNVAIPTLSLGRQTLYMLPDRILVFQGSAVGVVGYDQLRLGTSTTRFIESGSIPGDAPVVGSTWQYVNKSGGPDRRFNNNRQLPILQYGEVYLTSATGLNEAIQVSNPSSLEYFALGVRGLASILADGAQTQDGS
jgi:Protein of unknown function (DUF4236)